jgi:hypothetical protein
VLHVRLIAAFRICRSIRPFRFMRMIAPFPSEQVPRPVPAIAAIRTSASVTRTYPGNAGMPLSEVDQMSDDFLISAR